MTGQADPKRMKVLLAIAGVLLLVLLFTQVGGCGGDEDSPSTPPAQTTATTPAPDDTQPAPAHRPDSSDLPVNPTAPQRPQATVPIPTKFPGTGPVTIRYNPFRSVGSAALPAG